MLDKKVIDLLQKQINEEFYSAYLYLQFANHLEHEGFPGFANWYYVQAQEENDHALYLIKYLLANQIMPELATVAKPEYKYEGIEKVLEAALTHEQHITSLINAIYKAADEAADYRTKRYLDWFVKEQFEEEINAEELIDQYNLVKKCGTGIAHLDKNLAKRKHEPLSREVTD
ncbi:MAG: ferritin [Candidatus Riflebacteria bacterium]|nr:ferritin [Candidatus Riflebacteria bacterium]